MARNQTSTPPQAVTVPDLIGQTRAAADSALAKAGLQAQFNESGATVNDQSSAARVQVLQGSTIMLYVITNQAPPPPQMVIVPALLGLTLAEATSVLSELGLKVRFGGTGQTVVQQSPAAGQRVQQHTMVVLTIGSTIPK
jgi:beta-lactam-binding protein with PASTA domain